jgi:hypothetical protein
MEFKWDEGPSRELDAKVHMKLGPEENYLTYLADCHRRKYGKEMMRFYKAPTYIPYYSTDINAAMMVADKFSLSVDHTERGWFAGILSGPLEALVSAGFREGWVIAATPEMAICGAFLNTNDLSESKGIRLVAKELG